MGNFYTNVTVSGPSREAVIEALRALHRDAFVSPTVEGRTVVCDRECEAQDDAILTLLACRLSARLACPAIAVLNHDDDFLFCLLSQSGQVQARYLGGLVEDSDRAGMTPDKEFAAQLCSAFGCADRVEGVKTLFRASRKAGRASAHGRTTSKKPRGKAKKLEDIMADIAKSVEAAVAERMAELMAARSRAGKEGVAGESEGYGTLLIATDFHEALTSALGLGSASLQTGYRALEKGEWPSDELARFIRVTHEG